MTDSALAPRFLASAMKKNHEKVAAFQATFAERLEAKLPPAPELPVKLWVMDETRLGLHTVRRRRITLRGVKPVGVHQQRFENLYVYGAIAPTTGDSLFALAKTMTSEKFQIFLNQFAEAHAETLNVLLLDNSGTHTAKTLVIPANVVLLFQEPYAPELNPAERVWRALKDELAWERWTSLADLQDRLLELIGDWTDEMLQSLTSYPYIMAALSAQYT
jgi:transposase